MDLSDVKEKLLTLPELHVGSAPYALITLAGLHISVQTLQYMRFFTPSSCNG